MRLSANYDDNVFVSVVMCVMSDKKIIKIHLKTFPHFQRVNCGKLTIKKYNATLEEFSIIPQ